jgi:hypothetical protein
VLRALKTPLKRGSKLARKKPYLKGCSLQISEKKLMNYQSRYYSEAQKAWRARNPHYSKERLRAYYGTLQGRAKSMLYSARSRAKRYQLRFEIDESDITPFLSGSCPYTNVPFDFGPPPKGLRKNPWSPSIDQITPGLGYIKGNVEIVSTWWNIAKHEWPTHTNQLARQGLAKKAWPWQ